MAYSKEQIQQLFQSQFDQRVWTDFIINFFKAQTLLRVPEPLDIEQSEGCGYYWGKLSTNDDYEISFFYLKMNRSVDQRKVGLRQLINRYIKMIDSDAGIAVFDDGNHWRLSFITDMRGEKTAPKRYTFVFGDEEKLYNTAVGRFMDLQKAGISFKNIKEAFSVEALTKQFYNDLFNWYTWALDSSTGVYFPNNPNTNADDTKQLDTKLIRLITRLMFVWFIKQKGLVPANLFDPEEIKLYLKDFDENSLEQSNYYQAILQNLFFATLNRPIKNITYDKDGNEIVERRCFATNKDKPDVKSKYRYTELFKISEDRILKLFEFIPFINGGLFECLDKNKTSDGVEQAYYDDGFSRNGTMRNGHFTKRAFVPNKLFFDPNDGIISIFNRYNFTVEENSPSEQQIALDPELLGKVFENLLGVYNPETQKTARNASGSFYTPREIVNYMVDISLQSYLGNTDEVKALFTDDFEFDERKKAFYNEVIHRLQTIKVLDPACGSGAFPIGMLNRIVELLQNLHAEGSKYDLKLQIMENCIYGGDIQTIAAQITKLRFFISLVCDCEKTNNPDDNYGIPNLPNLETHFVTCNSLVGLKKPQQYSLFEQDVIALKEKLQEVRHDHFVAKTVYQKTKLRNRDKELRDELAKMLSDDNVIASEDAAQMVAWNPYDQNGKASFFDSEWMFGIRDGFDVVIGNPPYFQVPKGTYSATQFPYSEGKDPGKQNMYKLFVEHSYNSAKINGIACMIVQSSLMCDLSSKYSRELLLRHTCLEQIIEFPKTAPTPEGQVFASVCQGTCIYLFRKTEPENNAFVLSVNNDCTTLTTMQIETVLQDALIEFYPEDYAIPLLNKDEFKVLKKIKNEVRKLKDIIVDIAQGDMNLTSSSNEITINPTSVKLLRGRHVSSYHVDYNSVDEYIRTGFRQEYVNQNNTIQFIVCQEVSGTVDPRRLHAALTNTSESFLCGHTINKIRLKNIELNHYVIGLLNSSLMDWVFRKTSSNNHVGGYELKQLPIIIAKDIKPVEKIVNDIIAAKDQDLATDTSELEAQLDNAVYELYGIEGKDRELIEKNYV